MTPLPPLLLLILLLILLLAVPDNLLMADTPDPPGKPEVDANTQGLILSFNYWLYAYK